MQPTQDAIGDLERQSLEDLLGRIPTLADAAFAIVTTDVLDRKVTLAHATAKAWYARHLNLATRSHRLEMPDHPGRPCRPELRPPRDMPRRSAGGARGRYALLHALAHIELNAIDMTWDLVARFAQEAMPRAFFDDWVQVGLEEAKHFSLLSQRLKDLGGSYGDLPAHDGLWQAAHATGHDLLARLAIVPLILEARGLDVTPTMIENLEKAGDVDSAGIIKIIYRDEKRHVAFGMKWFRFLCERSGLPIETTFHQLVREHFRGPLKPPFNESARSEAGLTPGFYKPLTAFGAPP
ncbi:MAG: ferritin-like domain-containing protein [Hyphomicrobiaceae bacterium]